jgi:hypothetical protein
MVRAAVIDDIVFALASDHIYRVDALDKKRKAEEEAAAAAGTPTK